MRLLPVVAAGALVLAACSILYNPNNIDRVDPDAPPIDMAPPIDAPPDMPIDVPIDMQIDTPPGALDITAFEGDVIEGAGLGNSQPAVVILDVVNFTDNLTSVTTSMIDDNGAMRSVQVVGTRVSADRSQIAVALAIPVLSATGHLQSKTFDVTVTHMTPLGMESASEPIGITGLDELAPTGTLNTTTPLRPMYSQVRITSAVHVFGPNPALIRSMSDIVISAVIDVNGLGASPGAHGCAGGGSVGDGMCGDGRGRAGATNAVAGGGHGGGGGYATNGTVGVGGGGANGAAGTVTGEELLLSLTTAAGAMGNRGNGGGGGGNGLVAGTAGVGGAGGGGGGVLELTANGSITVDPAGRAHANGANGTMGTPVLGVGNGGHGGGGSGGTIVLRAGAGISAPAGWVSAVGGAGGGAGGQRGGSGGIGRVRIDASGSDATLAAMVTGPVPVRGIAWASVSPLVTSASPTFSLIGAPDTMYGFQLNNQPSTTVTTDTAGAATVMPALQEGFNTLCVMTSPTVTAQVLEATRCITAVWVP